MKTNTIFAYSWHIDPKEDRITSKRIYGITKDNKNVCIRIDNFTPFVYIELPENITWTNGKAQLVGNKLDSLLSPDQRAVTKSLVYKKRLYYAHLDANKKRKKFPYLFLSFCSQKDIKNLSYKLRKHLSIAGIGRIKLKMHEQDATPILQFTCMRNIPTAGWIKFHGKEVEKDKKITICDHEYTVKWKNVFPVNTNDTANPLICSFDIEVNSTNPSAMPNSKKHGDKVFQISCILARQNDDVKDYKNYLLSLGEPDQEKTGKDVNILKFDTEAELLCGFTDFIKKYNPNVICGYNILTFDIPYMIDRAKLLMCIDQFDMQGFTKYTHAVEEDIKWSSSAYKNQTFKFLDAEGRLFVDLLPLIKRDYKFANYKLKTVSTHFLGQTKDDLSPKGIFKCYRIGMKGGKRGSQALGIVGKYCIVDSVLVLKLFHQLQTWIGLTEMAKTCCVPMFYLYTQGQQIKVYSQVYKKCMYSGYIVEKDGYIPADDEHYRGATVLDPITGVHDKVVPYDFASLYPTTIIAYNICWSTLVVDENVPDRDCHVMEWEDHVGCLDDPIVKRKVTLTLYTDKVKAKLKKLRERRNKTLDKYLKKKLKKEIDQMVKDLKPYNKEKAECAKSKPKHVMCAKRKYRFLKEPKGVLPTILQNLLDARKETRKDIKIFKKILKKKDITEEEIGRVKEVIPEIIEKIKNKTELSKEDKDKLELLIKVYNKRQLAYKVSANSMYGAMGVTRGYLPFMPGAMATTFKGREAIAIVEKELPKHGGKVIYGDTDSNYATPPSNLLTAAEVWDWAVKTAKEITKLFPPPMVLEFEEVIYWRFLILTKKRYMSLKCYRDGVIVDGIEKKGVLLARRDNSGIVRDIYTQVIMDIFNKVHRDDILNKLITSLNNMCSNNTELSKFVVTKSVGDHGGLKVVPFIDEKDGKKKGMCGNYKVPLLSTEPEERARQYRLKNCDNPKDYYLRCLPGQIQLAERIRNRGKRVDVGTRLEYVVTMNGGHKAKQYVKIEDFEYFDNHSRVLNIDYMYYLKIAANSIDQVLDCCYKKDNGEKYKYKFTPEFVLNQYKLRINRGKVIKQLKDLFKPKLVFV